jgi:hypothetical protein
VVPNVLRRLVVDPQQAQAATPWRDPVAELTK